MRKAQVIMGTGVTIDIPEAGKGIVFTAAFDRLKEIDKKYSTYKKDSFLSRYIRGELKWWQKDREFTHILKACQTAQQATDGAFDAWVSGTYDPSGYVKGWAIAEAGRTIEKQGYGAYCISIGGDILARGDKIWRIGIQDPKDKLNSLTTLNIRNAAVATSGNYIRGQHIINPKTKLPADGLASLTVVGPDIIDADVLATAGFVLGDFAVRFIKSKPGYEAMAVHKNGHIEMTKGFQELIT